jgi:hypothetical protein
MIDRPGTGLAQPQYRRVAPDQRKSNESKTKKPTDEGWLFACCPKNKTGIAKTCCELAIVFWGTSKA